MQEHLTQVELDGGGNFGYRDCTHGSVNGGKGGNGDASNSSGHESGAGGTGNPGGNGGTGTISIGNINTGTYESTFTNY